MFDLSNWAVDLIRWMDKPFIVWPDGSATANMSAVWWILLIGVLFFGWAKIGTLIGEKKGRR